MRDNQIVAHLAAGSIPASTLDLLTCSLPPRSARKSFEEIVTSALSWEQRTEPSHQVIACYDEERQTRQAQPYVCTSSLVVVSGPAAGAGRDCLSERMNSEWAREDRSFMAVAARRFCASPWSSRDSTSWRLCTSRSAAPYSGRRIGEERIGEV